ncbi:MAG: BlaI/MecI/CopY family transcriptional regulator [Bacteroidaceae bacterium]|nr:BlaI/MecI/CopY family transcriptional regulator [Bacteroidaceae bacterium]
MVKNKKEINTLTKAEMEIMNTLWDAKEPMSTHAIIERYPEPKPAYSTIATFMKILTNKEFVSFRKGEERDKTFYFYPLITRVEYTRKFMNQVKTTFFGGSVKSLISFFAKEEKLSDEELKEILSFINSEE